MAWPARACIQLKNRLIVNTCSSEVRGVGTASHRETWTSHLDLAQASLQSFAWTEKDRAQVRAERAAQCGSELQRKAVLAEPVFCFETACKALYWSTLVYRLQVHLPCL